MGTTIRKSTLYQLLFVLCVGVPYLNNYELTFAVWTTAALLTIQSGYSVALIRQVLCFVAILLLAIVVMFFYDYKAYYIIRDITYVVKPAIGLVLGYQLCRGNFKNMMHTIVYTAVFIAVIHLIVICDTIITYRGFVVNKIRISSGFFSDFEVYALIILLFHKKFQLEFSKNRLRLFTLLVGVSAFLYLSRTNIIQFVILVVAMKGYFKINRRSIIVVSSVAIATVIGYTAILYYNPRRNGPGMEAFLYKIKVAPIEPFKTKIDRGDWKDFNDNYRSYENINTVRQLTANGTAAVIFGEGVGSKIDLKQEIMLGDMKLRYISILHNGFMTVFLKSGLIGVFFLLLSIAMMFRLEKTDIPIVREINLLMVGSGVFFLVSYWVFMGYYFIADTKAIFIGALLCYKAFAEKQHAAP